MIVRKLVSYAVRLSLLLFTGVVMSGALSVPAQADEGINLELGGEGSTSWNINNTIPGDSGTKTVELHNASSSDGFVLIWISDVISSEGVNYESETGNTAEPGELTKYMLFNVSCSRLDTSLNLPATVEGLPQSAIDPNSIMISPINAGETVTLVWEWQFNDTGGDQNDAQGDSLSFTINYLLQELTTPDNDDNDNDDDEGGGNGAVNFYSPWFTRQKLEVDMFGKVSLDWVSDSGMLLNSLVITSPDGRHKLEFNQGTAIFSYDRKIITKIEVRECREPRLPLDGMKIIGSAYDIIGYVGNSMVRSVIFNQPVKLTLGYKPEWLPVNASPELFIAWYDEENDWVVCNLANGAYKPGEISAFIKHASTFAILGRMKPAAPEVNVTPISNPESEETTTTEQDTPDNQSVTSVPQDNTEEEELQWQASPPVPSVESKEFLRWASLGVALTGLTLMTVLLCLQRRRQDY